MEVIEFFESGCPQGIAEQIHTYDWGGAKFLYELITENRFMQVLGNGGKLFILLDGEKLVSFATLTQRDCVDAAELYPWIGFVFTCPEYRGGRCAGKVLACACEVAAKQGYKLVYLATDHTGLYEKYGFEYKENRIDIDGEDSRIYIKVL